MTRGRIEDEAGSAVAATQFGEMVYGVDLPVPRQIERRLVPPLGHYLTRLVGYDQGAEGQLGTVGRQRNGPTHEAFVIGGLHQRATSTVPWVRLSGSSSASRSSSGEG
jgi:hypothetical protein